MTVHIEEADLEKLAKAIAKSLQTVAAVESPQTQSVEPPRAEGSRNERMAFTVSETAELLGVSHITVYRLIQRGLLKPSSALRIKIISRTEIQRFLSRT